MKLRTVLITVITVVFFLFEGTLYAQGIYSANNQTTSAPAPMDNGGGGIYRAGGGGSDGPGAPGGNSTPAEAPIGEGFLILSLLAGGYALLKKNVRGKHED